MIQSPRCDRAVMTCADRDLAVRVELNRKMFGSLAWAVLPVPVLFGAVGSAHAGGHFGRITRLVYALGRSQAQPDTW